MKKFYFQTRGTEELIFLEPNFQKVSSISSNQSFESSNFIPTNSSFSIELSIFDKIHINEETIFYWEFDEPLDLKLIKVSLSKTLVFFPLLLGKVVQKPNDNALYLTYDSHTPNKIPFRVINDHYLTRDSRGNLSNLSYFVDPVNFNQVFTVTVILLSHPRGCIISINILPVIMDFFSLSLFVTKCRSCLICRENFEL